MISARSSPSWRSGESAHGALTLAGWVPWLREHGIPPAAQSLANRLLVPQGRSLLRAAVRPLWLSSGSRSPAGKVRATAGNPHWLPPTTPSSLPPPRVSLSLLSPPPTPASGSTNRPQRSDTVRTLLTTQCYFTRTTGNEKNRPCPRRRLLPLPTV